MALTLLLGGISLGCAGLSLAALGSGRAAAAAAAVGVGVAGLGVWLLTPPRTRG